MKASKAIKIAEQVLDVVCNYADVAMQWDPEKEDDYQNFKDDIIDTIAAEGEAD